MRGFLLDTNILSELRKRDNCHQGVRRWFAAVGEDDLFLSVLVLGEIRQGIERIRSRDLPSARTLEKWLRSLSTKFVDRILPVDEQVADQWGRLGLRQPVPVLDGLLAATALVYDLAMVSRDVDGFLKTGVQLINPFAANSPPDN